MHGYGFLVDRSSHFAAIDCSAYKEGLACRFTWASPATERWGSVCVVALHQSHSATLNDRIILLLLVDWEFSPMITSARCVLLCVCVCGYMCIYRCACVHVRAWVCGSSCVCTCACVYMYMSVCICMCMCVYVMCVCVYMCICVCVCVCVCAYEHVCV